MRKGRSADIDTVNEEETFMKMLQGWKSLQSRVRCRMSGSFLSKIRPA